MRSSVYYDEMRIAGALPAGGTLLYLAGAWIDPGRDVRVGVGVALAMILAGLVTTRRPLVGRVLASGALAIWVLVTVQPLSTSPAAALVVWLPVLWFLTALWIIPGLPGSRRTPSNVSDSGARLARLRVSLRITALLVIAVALSRSESDADVHAALIASILMTLFWAVRATLLQTVRRRWLALLVAAPLLAAVAVLGGQGVGDMANVLLMLVVLFASVVVRERRRPGQVQSFWWERLFDHPARQLVTTFLFLILTGTLLLELPLAAAGDEPVRVVDAAFTSVSAVCVTGLIVLDTPVDWSIWGQGIILVLIQLGGLGIMSFATAFLSALGQRLPVRQEGAFAQLTSGEDRRELYTAVKTVLYVTFTAELVGAALLLPRFLIAGDAFRHAVWSSIFTAVSAFCNAGFALQSDNLVGFARDPWLLHIVAILIVLGGLSPAVIVALVRRRGISSLQLRLVLWTTVALLVVGAMLFAASEWNNTLAALGLWDKLHNAWFQSATLRTAGFNSIDFAALRPATVTLCLLWMFIGGSPGGTAGGIKTTTFAVLVLAVVATVQGRHTVTVFGRTISQASVFRAASVATIGCLALIIFVLAIQLTQVTEIIPGIFEVVSALGTVGLSMGATATLDTVGKIIIMVAMFAGRVGSLTLIMFLIAQRDSAPWRVPEETVAVG
ncbi:MAG TPA: potassium transporter TrkG [Candidatus Krumholzibacteria bacterium]|nr:potassium transporter TrkG [Candidatus Krumholzibacteria bacterium]HPD70682.1 potassium transporter TrkG [Candidatus Krumholzibacteria bacterium]HRY39618.1 potassium transporter TrkG [Candidatus Krumholzibacteria bacterium]